MSNLPQADQPDVSQASSFLPPTLFNTGDSSNFFEDELNSEWQCHDARPPQGRPEHNSLTGRDFYPDQQTACDQELTPQHYVQKAIERLTKYSFRTPHPQTLANVNKHFDQVRHPSDKRRHRRRCLGCVTHPKKPLCEDHPRCKNCTLLRPLLVEPTTPKLHTVFYLDWIAWFKACDDLGQKFIQFDQLRSHPTEVIQLRLSFLTGQCAGNVERKATTILDPQLNADFWFEQTAGDHNRRINAPIADFEDLDGFVACMVWCKHCEKGHDRMLSKPEIALFSVVKLFAGYFSLIHNLPNTIISSSGLCGNQIIGFTAAALTYSFVFRLQMLFTEIAVLCDDLMSEISQEKHPATVFYALETLYRFIMAAPQTPWNISSTEHPLNPLVPLQRAFIERSKHLKDRILDYECLYSGIDEKACRMQLHPMVKFARDAEFKLPYQLKVEAKAYMKSESSNQQMNFMHWISQSMTAVDALSDSNARASEQSRQMRLSQFTTIMIASG